MKLAYILLYNRNRAVVHMVDMEQEQQHIVDTLETFVVVDTLLDLEEEQVFRHERWSVNMEVEIEIEVEVVLVEANWKLFYFGGWP